ncbi:MAG: glycoside hydrolase family 57 protein [Thermoplasmatota archaeon]
MTSVCMYFQVHQPMRLRRLHIFNMPQDFDYWDHPKNKAILDRVAEKCYLPTNRELLSLINATGGRFRFAFSLSGTFLWQIEQHRPDVLESFQALAETGAVEFLEETYYHSLAGLWPDQTEYKAQIREHRDAMKEYFGVEPKVFRNTELIYDDRIAKTVEELGYKAIMTEGTEKILDWRSPNYLYRPSRAGAKLSVLLKNYRLSDDVAFRFSSRAWPEWPLTAEKYASWLTAAEGQTVNLFMDFETFGEHQWKETGIFEFLRHLPGEVLKHRNLEFATPTEVVAKNEPVGGIEVPFAISWADSERDVSAWLHNEMQHTCFNNLGELGPLVREINDAGLTRAWRLLQTSDHLYYCATKWMGDQDVHTYFSPYDSPYQAFINLSNAIQDLQRKAVDLARSRGVAIPISS